MLTERRRIAAPGEQYSNGADTCTITLPSQDLRGLQNDRLTARAV